MTSRINVAKLFLFTLSLASIGFGGSMLYSPAVEASGTEPVRMCCSFGSDCNVDVKCCAPGPGEAPCSAEKGGYCRRDCNQVVPDPRPR